MSIMTMYPKKKFGRILNFNFVYKIPQKKHKADSIAISQDTNKKIYHQKQSPKKDQFRTSSHYNSIS